MTKFKVGDRVERTKIDFTGNLLVGSEYLITEFLRHGSVKLTTVGGTPIQGEYDPGYFKLVSRATDTFKVGDRVCRTRKDYSNQLKVGQHYIVLASIDGSITVRTVEGTKIPNTYSEYYFELVTPAEPAASVTHDSYDQSMLPMFARLAEAADKRGFCSTYDEIAAVVGAPSRAKIKELTKPSLLQQFEALRVGATFQFTDGTARAAHRVKISSTQYARPDLETVIPIERASRAGRTLVVVSN